LQVLIKCIFYAFCNLSVLTSMLLILLKSHSYYIFIKVDLGVLIAVVFFYI